MGIGLPRVITRDGPFLELVERAVLDGLARVIDHLHHETLVVDGNQRVADELL